MGCLLIGSTCEGWFQVRFGYIHFNTTPESRSLFRILSHTFSDNFDLTPGLFVSNSASEEVQMKHLSEKIFTFQPKEHGADLTDLHSLE